LSQDITNRKRRWLAALISVAKPKATWLVPALLAPAMTVGLSSNAFAQAPMAPTTQTQPLNAAPQVNADLVIRWLDIANQKATADDLKSAAGAFAEALRGRDLLGQSKDARVEARLKEVEKTLVGKGIKKQQIIDALNALGPMGALPQARVTAPTSAAPTPVAQAGHTPGLPPLPTNNAAAQQNAAQPNAVQPSVFLPQTDRSRTQPASAVQAAEPVVPGPALGDSTNGDALYRRGLDSLRTGDSKQALELFRQAWQYQGEMDPLLRNQLREKLSLMSAPSEPSQSTSGNVLDPMAQQQLAARQRLMSEVTGEIAAAEANQESEPLVVAERLQALRTRVSQADLDGTARKQMLTIVDRAITAHQIYMSTNKSAIDQNMRNREVTEHIALEGEARYKTEQQVASLVETYNDLMDKHSYAEAEVVAKQVAVIDPNSLTSRLLIANARNARSAMESERIKANKEEGFVKALNAVEAASTPISDDQLYQFPDAPTWNAISEKRLNRDLPESRRGMTPAETAIWDKLKQPILVDFKSRPLTEVVRTLSDMTGILIHVDQASLAADGISSELPVTLSLPSQISLQSALNIILNSQNLDFVVRNEVLMITSAKNTAQANVSRTYNVRDLVLPIPNFVTDYNSGMGGALRSAYETIGRGLVAQTNPMPGVSPQTQLASASIDPNAPVLGQLNNQGANAGIPPQALWGSRGGFGGNGPQYGAGNMGGLPPTMAGPTPLQGGAVIADFDTLMNLIQQTIDPESWLQAGGNNTINQYPATLSIVVSAPQTTHERITDLLESLRRLQDLQVTIEVKFITLSDNFFERIGVDFDVKIDDNVRRLPNDDQGPSTTVGLSTGLLASTPSFTTDLDVTLNNGSFTSAVPAFGNFDAASGTSLGVAILSDLELFFFMNAAQGDTRSNVLQAPRVTMFDGQTASINDTVQTPFVTSLIPVVGDFAVAQQPVIVILNEGTVLNVQAVVSPDKRFVRVTLNPTFSRIDRVATFQFEGSRTTRNTTTRGGTNVLDPDGIVNDADDEQLVTQSGTTVQQPSFATTSVSTTVSVPDGGTILLGGIKRMREGRIERGVPVLSKIPYVNRLFKNTAIGRETNTLMMTVTPHIIIQEEEEERYGVSP
jgi:general secretion pathway protein D